MSDENDDVLTNEDIEQTDTGISWWVIAIIIVVAAIIFGVGTEFMAGGSRFGDRTFSYSPGSALMRA